MNNKAQDQGLVVAGWWTTVLITPVGIILAIILLAKGTRNKHAGWMLGVGLLWVTICLSVAIVSINNAADAAAGSGGYEVVTCYDHPEAIGC